MIPSLNLELINSPSENEETYEEEAKTVISTHQEATNLLKRKKDFKIIKKSANK